MPFSGRSPPPERKTAGGRSADFWSHTHTRSFHHFYPTREGAIAYKRISADANAAGLHYFFTPETKYLFDEIQLRTYVHVVCEYDDSWWIGRINDKDIKDPLTNEILIAFMYPQGPSSAFYWPRNHDLF